MSSIFNQNQVFLITLREDVVLFCNQLFQKFATVQRVNSVSEVPKDFTGIVTYDAIDNLVTIDFLNHSKNAKFSLIAIISPCLSVFLQQKLKSISPCWIHSHTASNATLKIEAYLKSKYEDENHNFVYGNSIIAENQSIHGFFAGVSCGIHKFRTELQKVAALDTPVLLLGETGCGKTSAARLIHKLSSRKNGPFIEVNVAEIVPSLCESTFFGKTTGAYTDATADTGVLYKSNHGIIFLDEIGLIKLMVQGKLLTFLETQCITPVGSSKSEKVDTRIILATNADLKSMIMEGTFRRDLYHRIDNHVLKIPALRQRPEDIPYIAKQYLKKKNTNKFLSNQAIDKMMNYAWPGNIRELHHCIDRALENSQSEKIFAEAIDFGLFA